MNKEILRLAIPNVISNISIPLLSTVDTALMGRLSELHLGAVGIGAMIFNILYWNLGFLRMGTTGITAQAYGKKDKVEIIHTLGRAMLLVILLSSLLVLFQQPLANWMIQLMNISEEQIPLVQNYFFIRIWAAPATIALFAMMGWFFGMQNAVLPLVLTIVINVVNILGSYYMVHILGWGIAGVAWGTVLAQYVGVLVALILFWINYRAFIKMFHRKALYQLEALKSFLEINKDIFIRTVCLTTAFGFFYRQSAEQGASILAINVILLQFVNWMSYGVDGFAYASESLVGKYKGAGVGSQLQAAIRLSFFWGIGLAVVYTLCYFLFSDILLGLFTDQAHLLVQSQSYLIWIILFPLIGTPCYIWDGVFIGLTASKAMRQTMLIAVTMYIGVFYMLPTSLSNHALWLALLVFMAARGGLQWFWYHWFVKVNQISLEHNS